jgi:hypothetical protein
VAIDLTPLRASRDFRRLWTGLFVSEFGFQFTLVATYVQVTRLTGSAAAIGLIGLVGFTGLVVGSLVGASFLDAVDRRKILIASQFGYIAAAALLLAGAIHGDPPVGLVYAAVAMIAAVSAVDGPTRSALTPRLVGRDLVPAPGFVKGLAELCSEHGILFIADEIQSGMGRAGRWFAIEDEGVVPDLVTSAKSLGGGLPISAITGRAEIMDAVHVGGLGGTYGGNPVAAAAALAVLDQIEREDLLERSRTLGEKVMGRLREMQDRHSVIGDVRGRGMMNAIELVADRETKEPIDGPTGTAIVRRCLEEGVVILKAGTYDNVIRLLPPLTIDEGLLDEGLSILEDAIRV